MRDWNSSLQPFLSPFFKRPGNFVSSKKAWKKKGEKKITGFLTGGHGVSFTLTTTTEKMLEPSSIHDSDSDQDEEEDRGLRNRRGSKRTLQTQDREGDYALPADYDQAWFSPGFQLWQYINLQFFRKFFLFFYTIVRAAIDVVLLVVRLVAWILSFWRWFLFLALITILWYLVVIYWVYVIQVVLTVAIPIVNVLIIIFNFAVELFIIIWDIGATIWNCIVPFLGMILYVVINVVLTVLADIFDVIGSIDWEPVINALMQIINVIVEIATQILLVIIKVGGEILKLVAKVIGPILQLVMEFVKIWAAVLGWILKLLFVILEPILKIIAAFFGGGGSDSGDQSKATGPDFTGTSKGSASTARRLLGLDRFSLSDAEEREIIADFHKHVYSLPDEGLSDEERRTLQLLLYDKAEEEHEAADHDLNAQLLALQRAFDDDNDDDSSSVKTLGGVSGKRKRGYDVEFVDEHGEPIGVFAAAETSKLPGDFDEGFSSGRRLYSVQKPWKLERSDGLKFVVRDQDDERRAKRSLDEAQSEKRAHTVGDEMYVHYKDMPIDDYNLAMSSMKSIMNEHSKKKHLGLNALLRNMGKSYDHLMPAHEERLSSVQYAVPSHPRTLLPSFHKEAVSHFKEQLESTGGRRLLSNYRDVRGRRMSDIRIEHAKNVLNRFEEYRSHNDMRVKVATVVYSAVTRSLHQSMSEVMTPELLLRHYSDLLDYFNYKTIQDVRMDFLARYGDPWGFLTNISYVTEHPVLRAFKKRDPSREDSPFFHDWAVEARKLHDERLQRQAASGRKLMQSEGNVRGYGDSSGALSGFATIAGRNCFSSPKNALCLPIIPMDTRVKIGLIHLTAHQRAVIESPTTHCTPWRFTNCIICWDRLWNACVEVFFLLTAIPRVNYSLATVLEVMPFLKPAFDWIFVVPKYGYPTTYQWVCFAFHLYDLWVVIIVVYIGGHILGMIWEVVSTTWANIQVLLYSGRGEHPLWARCLARSIQREARDRELLARYGDDNDDSGDNFINRNDYYDDDDSDDDSSDEEDDDDGEIALVPAAQIGSSVGQRSTHHHYWRSFHVPKSMRQSMTETERRHMTIVRRMSKSSRSSASQSKEVIARHRRMYGRIECDSSAVHADTHEEHRRNPIYRRFEKDHED